VFVSYENPGISDILALVLLFVVTCTF